jgi:hypothetical protein
VRAVGRLDAGELGAGVGGHVGEGGA